MHRQGGCNSERTERKCEEGKRRRSRNISSPIRNIKTFNSVKKRTRVRGNDDAVIGLSEAIHGSHLISFRRE